MRWRRVGAVGPAGTLLYPSPAKTGMRGVQHAARTQGPRTWLLAAGQTAQEGGSSVRVIAADLISISHEVSLNRVAAARVGKRGSRCAGRCYPSWARADGASVEH